MSFKSSAQQILSHADITINGKKPYDIQVKNDKFYRRVMGGGSLALGDSYMDGWWECKKLDECIARILSAKLDEKIRPTCKLIVQTIIARIINAQTKSKAKKVGRVHYDKGNELYKAMLDKRLTYTCGYWKTANTLDTAQEAKLDLVCKKLRLKKGQKILDIGGGWGSFAKFAAEKYGVRVVAITISKEQIVLGKKLCEGLPVEIRFQDYRDVTETFDHIVSLGMFEHVGYKNYKKYMGVVHRCLKDNGLFLLHTIGSNKSVTSTDPWIAKHIFPNSMLPSIAQIGKSVEHLFVMEDWHNFGTHYDKTLMAWFNNFDKAWPHLKQFYDERFRRMWTYYLLSCAGLFRARNAQVWQVVLSKNGKKGGYDSIR